MIKLYNKIHSSGVIEEDKRFDLNDLSIIKKKRQGSAGASCSSMNEPPDFLIERPTHMKNLVRPNMNVNLPLGIEPEAWKWVNEPEGMLFI